MANPPHNEPIVITGIGTVSPLGLNARDTWDALTTPTPGISPIGGFDASGFITNLGGEVKNFKPASVVPKSYRKATKVMARDTALAVAAARAAVEHAGLTTHEHADDPDAGPTTYDPARLACSIGAGLISADTVELATALAPSIPEGDTHLDHEHWGEQGMSNLTPLWMLKYLPNMPACHVTIIHGAKGPSNTIVCGEASGLLSIAEAARTIQRGAADAALAGGIESKLNPLGLARMIAYDRVLTSDTDEASPGEATDEGWTHIRPFDHDAPGSVVGEGGAITVLERRSDAIARGATPIAVVAGQGSSQTIPVSPAAARHPCDPTDGHQSESARDHASALGDAIERAIADAGLTPDDIDAIVPHAPGVPRIDLAERLAYQIVFGDRLAQIPLITTSPFVGDLIAGHGSFAAAVAALAIHHQTLPARIHAGSPHPSTLAGPTESTPATLNAVLACSTSLGGQCAALVLTQPPAS